MPQLVAELSSIHGKDTKPEVKVRQQVAVQLSRWLLELNKR